MARPGLSSKLAVAWVSAVLYAATAPARAEAPARPTADDTLARLAAAVRARLGDAAAAHMPALVPPVAVTPKWNPKRIGSLPITEPIVAITAADLDKDGKPELYIVTSREVIAVGIAGKVKELGRVAFSGEHAIPAPRDVVGTAVVEGDSVVASVSGWAKDLRVEWRKGAKVLTAKHGPGGFMVCGTRMQLATGRNHFHEGTNAMFGAVCKDDLKDAAGYPLHVRAELAVSGVLDVTVEKCAPNGTACQPAGNYDIKDVGVAFEIADVDRDGTPEVIVSNASAPGDPDAVRVITLGTPPNKPAFKKLFNSGVEGIVAVDDNGVAEIIAVVRLVGVGANRVDLWRLD